MSNEATMRKFFEELESLDMKRIADYCAEGCVYEDVPIGDGATAVGPEAIRAKLEGGFKHVDKLVTTIHELAENGNTLLVERTEVWHHPTGEVVPLPVMAVFKFDDAGKITLWRDHWDVATLMNNQPKSWLERLAKNPG
jgi:limonene-1,2-epoxide hydrolase